MGYVFSNFSNEISFREYNLSKDPLQPQVAGVIFIYLCVDFRHKQKHTVSSNSFYVSHLNKPMKNSVYKQKRTADPVKLHVVFTNTRRNTQQTRWSSTHLITKKLLQFYNTYFFFIYVQTTSTSTQQTRQLATCFTQSFIFFFFINRLQAQARPRHSGSEAGPGEACTIFY